MDYREVAQQIFIAGVKDVLPGRLISNMMSLKGHVLYIGNQSYDLEKINSIYIIGAGKASAAMGHYVENILGNRIREGHIIVKYGYFCKLKYIRVTEAGHPIPDSNSFRATEEIVQLANKAGENDLVICLLSGGGSSLLADIPEASAPDEIMRLNDLLVRSGADIRQINSVRKHLSKVKGGQLSRFIWPANTVNLILSDVLGDPVDIVASGPTVPDSSTFAEALKVLEDHQIINLVPAGILDILYKGVQGILPETPKSGDPIFSKTVTFLAGNNKASLNAAKDKAENLGFNTFIISDEMKGDIINASSYIIDTVIYYKNNNSIQKPVCLLFGGETTVRVQGNGMGGRNQHLALTVALRLQDISGITFLSGGTDGNDGNTEMAGAVVDSETVHDAHAINVYPEKYLSEFDSYHFFKSTGGHIFTGPTMTNVMDIVVVLID